MQISPLEEIYRARGVTTTEYRGSLTAAEGGNADRPAPRPAAQVLLYDASWRAGVAVTGPDARKWLNGMLSANLRDMAPGGVAPSFQLDPKGHILATLDVLCLAEASFLLLTDEAQSAGLIERLRRFVFLSKLTLENRSEAASSLLLRGAGWQAAWKQSGLPALARADGGCAVLSLGEEGEAVAAVSQVGGVPQLELIAAPAVTAALWLRLEAAATTAGSTTFERDRILSRVPRYGADITAGELPQETGQMDRLDFTKGCYVGQEIVERIRARGAVHRHFTGFRLAAAVEPGTPLRVAAGDGGEAREVGKITSLTRRAEDWFGLGYIREPHQTPGTALQAGAASAWVEGI